MKLHMSLQARLCRESLVTHCARIQDTELVMILISFSDVLRASFLHININDESYSKCIVRSLKELSTPKQVETFGENNTLTYPTTYHERCEYIYFCLKKMSVRPTSTCVCMYVCTCVRCIKAMTETVQMIAYYASTISNVTNIGPYGPELIWHFGKNM